MRRPLTKINPTDTPAPNTPQPITGRDFRSACQSYGANQYAGPSSANPGKSITSAMADELRSKQTGLDEVIAHGSRHSDNPDTFNGRGNVKAAPAVAFGNKNPNAGGAPMGDVPGGLHPSSKRI